MCSYRGSDFKKALEYLKKALVFESKLEEEQEEYIAQTENIMLSDEHKDNETLKFIKCNSAGTILNICAILSKLNK